MRLLGVDARAVPQAWPVVRPLIEKALEHGGGKWGLHDVLASLLDGSRQLWTVDDGKPIAAVVTEIRVYPTGAKAAVVFLAAGRRDADWLDWLETIKAWGRAGGCKWIELEGRRGWQRALPDWSLDRIVMSKEL